MVIELDREEVVGSRLRHARRGRTTGRWLRAVATLALAGAVMLAMMPLIRAASPFDAVLRTVVWLATVVAALSGAGRPAAVFGVVAAIVETAGVFTGPHPLGVCAMALLVAGALVLTRNVGAASRWDGVPGLSSIRAEPPDRGAGRLTAAHGMADGVRSETG